MNNDIECKSIGISGLVILKLANELINSEATYTDEKDEKLAIRLGADRFLRKPEQWDDLLKTIQDVIRDVKKGRAKKPKTLVLEDDKKIYKLYSERLVKKLEK